MAANKKATEELNNLFKEWKSSSEEYKTDFAEDGILDEDKWTKSKRKILFVLKETNRYSGDLRSLIRESGGFIHNVGRWAYGLQNLNKLTFPNYSEAKEWENISNSLLSSAIINLKKKSGKGSSNMGKIREYALRDKGFIKEEIDIIRPDVIVCGYTRLILEEMFPNDIKKSYLDDLSYQFGNIPLIAFWHPSARFPAKMLYYTICSTFQKML